MKKKKWINNKAEKLPTCIRRYGMIIGGVSLWVSVCLPAWLTGIQFIWIWFWYCVCLDGRNFKKETEILHSKSARGIFHCSYFLSKLKNHLTDRTTQTITSKQNSGKTAANSDIPAFRGKSRSFLVTSLYVLSTEHIGDFSCSVQSHDY